MRVFSCCCRGMYVFQLYNKAIYIILFSLLMVLCVLEWKLSRTLLNYCCSFLTYCIRVIWIFHYSIYICILNIKGEKYNTTEHNVKEIDKNSTLAVQQCSRTSSICCLEHRESWWEAMAKRCICSMKTFFHVSCQQKFENML